MSNANATNPSDSFKVKNGALDLNLNKRKELAIHAISGKSTITSLAEKTNTSRKFIYAQKDKGIKALDTAFSEVEPDEEKVLFCLPVTKSWLKQLVIALIFICHSSYQGVIEVFRDLLHIGISKGNIHNILQGVLEKITEIHRQQDLSQIKVGAHDEIFQNGLPVLVGCDAHSTYCYLLSEESHRDANTWGYHLLDLQQKNNLKPEYSIADGALGLRKGQKEAWPNIPCHGDVFHALKPFLELSSYLDNRAMGTISAVAALEKKLSKPRKMSEYKQRRALERKRRSAEIESERAIKLTDDIRILYGWLKNDVLSLVGPLFKERQELFNFITTELRIIEHQSPDKINSLRTFLENNRDNLLRFSSLIDKKLQEISIEFKVSLDNVRAVYDLKSLPFSSQAKWEKESETRQKLGNWFYPIEEEVKELLKKTIRASSIVENLNSRLRNYFTLRRTLGKGYLDLLRFFLNHRRFMRSEHPERVGKSPRELMSGEPHEHWLELLGFKLFKKAV